MSHIRGSIYIPKGETKSTKTRHQISLTWILIKINYTSARKFFIWASWMNLLLHFQNIFATLPNEPQRMEKSKQCWPGKVNQLNENKWFFPFNFFLAGKKKCLKKHSSRLTSRLPEKFYCPPPRTAQWLGKPVKKTCYPPDGFAQVISYCHGWKGSTATPATRIPTWERGKPTNTRRESARSELRVSQHVSGPPVSPKSPPSPSLRSEPSRPPSSLPEAAILIDASAKERLQSLNLVLCFQWCYKKTCFLQNRVWMAHLYISSYVF